MLRVLALMTLLPCFALGLGSIEVRSNLAEPFDAVVPIVGAPDVKVLDARLASYDDFVRQDIERLTIYNSLQFEVIAYPNPHIHIYSATPIKEPYMNFLIELDYRTGKLLREYAVLLDFGTRAATPVRTVLPEPQEALMRGVEAVKEIRRMERDEEPVPAVATEQTVAQPGLHLTDNTEQINELTDALDKAEEELSNSQVEINNLRGELARQEQSMQELRDMHSQMMQMQQSLAAQNQALMARLDAQANSSGGFSWIGWLLLLALAGLGGYWYRYRYMAVEDFEIEVDDNEEQNSSSSQDSAEPSEQSEKTDVPPVAPNQKQYEEASVEMKSDAPAEEDSGEINVKVGMPEPSKTTSHLMLEPKLPAADKDADAVAPAHAYSSAARAQAVIKDVDVFLADRNFPAAIELLEDAIGKDSKIVLLQLKMAQVAAMSGDQERYERVVGAIDLSPTDPEYPLYLEITSKFSKPD